MIIPLTPDLCQETQAHTPETTRTLQLPVNLDDCHSLSRPPSPSQHPATHATTRRLPTQVRSTMRHRGRTSLPLPAQLTEGGPTMMPSGGEETATGRPAPADTPAQRGTPPPGIATQAQITTAMEMKDNLTQDERTP